MRRKLVGARDSTRGGYDLLMMVLLISLLLGGDKLFGHLMGAFPITIALKHAGYDIQPNHATRRSMRSMKQTRPPAERAMRVARARGRSASRGAPQAALALLLVTMVFASSVNYLKKEATTKLLSYTSAVITHIDEASDENDE